MVFESIVADLLNRFIGDYVENLDRKQLKIGIWGGDVVLNNLILKQSALNDLDLPVTTSYGHLGKLVLKIPWKNLYSSPVEAYVEKLYLLVVPNTAVKYDAGKEDKLVISTKKAQIERYEQVKKAEEEKDKPKADKTFAEKLTTQIINNVQIKINDIHIRYEDSTTTGTPFAFGITLSELSVHTTDELWVQSLVAATVTRIFKVAQLEGLAMYMNCNTSMFQYDHPEAFNRLFQDTIASKSSTPENYKYILGPISAVAKLQMVPNPEADESPFTTPKVKLNLNLEKLALGITRLQYQDLIQLVETMGRMSRGVPYRKYRPYGITYRGHAKEWWNFAFQCVLETEVRRRKQNWSWEHIKGYREKYRSYAEAYKMKLLSKKPTPEMIACCDDYERDLDLNSILFLRKKAELAVKKVEKDNQEVQKSQGWFSGWWSGTKKDDDNDNAATNIKKQFEAAMTGDEKEKLFEAIGYDESELATELPEHFIANFIDFELNSLVVTVASEVTEPNSIETYKNIMKFKLKSVNCIIEQRPAASAIKLIVNMKELTVTGLQQEEYLPIIVQSRVETTKSLLDIMFETNPLDKKCDQRVKVSSRPLQIAYDAETVIELQKVFKAPETTTTLAQWQDAAAVKMLDIKERSATGLQYAIHSHPRLEVNILLMPSYLVVPHGGKFLGNESVVVVSLGKLLMSTEPRPLESQDVKAMHESGASQEEILAEMIFQSYDKFNLEIQNIQAIVAAPTEDWQSTILENNVTEMHILQPTTLKLSAHLCVIEDDPRLPKCKISGEIPKIHINVTENRVMDAYAIVSSLPLPENEEVQPKLLNKESNILSSSLSLLKFLDEKQKTISLSNKAEIPASDDLVDDLVQFTDLEIKLVMSELCVTMHQPLIDSDSSNEFFETPTEEFGPPTKPAVSFDVSDFPDQKKIILFKLQRLELNMAQRTYDMRLGLILGAVGFDQFRFKNEKEKVIHVISTPHYNQNADYLFSLNYTDCKKQSPEFATKHKSVEKLVEINFSTLLLILHQEAIIELIELSNEFQSRMEAINRMNERPRDRIATTHDESTAGMLLSAAKEKLPAILEDETATVLPKRRDKRGSVVDSIKIKVLARMEDVTVEMQTDKRSLACLEVKNLTANVVLKTTYTEVNLKLQDIIVTDMNPLSIHTKILSIVGDNAMACQIVMFNLDETSQYNSDSMRIDVTMGCAKIVFLNWFVTSVLNFLDHFQTAQQKIKEASAAVAEAAKSNVVDAYVQATRMRLLVKINAPIIIVPVASDSLEAIAIDLGHLNISNNFVDINVQDDRSPAVIDEMRIELKDMKVSKVSVRQSVADISSSSSIAGSEDIVYGLNTGTNILNPTTFSLLMQRNLSSSWFKDRPEIDISGRLKDIELNVISDDYNIAMQILAKNMTEGQEKGKPVTAPAKVPPSITTRAEINDKDDSKAKKIREIKSQASLAPKQKTIDTFLKFAFQIDSVTVNLFTVPGEGLATIALYFFSLKGQKLADGSLSTAIILCDVHLDDTRPNREKKITRFMERRQLIGSTSSFVENDSTTPTRSMIDVTFNMKDSDIFADVKVFSFNLIIYLDFLLKVSNFFQTPPLTEEQEFAQKQQQAQTIRKSSSTQIVSSAEDSKNITLMLHIEQPDIILVEKMDDINCYALILNNQISLKVRLIGEKQIIQGEISDFCLYLSEFNPEKRNSTKHYVIHPCSISLNGSTPENKGLHLSLQSTHIKICISPAIIELWNNVSKTLTTTEQSAEDMFVEEIDHSNLWDVKSFDEDQFWFIRVDEAEDALSMVSLGLEEVKPELCLVDVPSIIVIIEAGSGVHTIPMLYLETSLEAKVNNWSSEMAIESALRLNMSYFNNTLALWEPLIEKVEKETESGLYEFLPWELNFDLKVDKHRDEVPKKEPTTKIVISSKDTLEMTCTKTCLDVLQSLGKSFSEAISSDGLIKPECEAPFIVKNSTGMEIEINLSSESFVLHPAHFGPPDSKLNENVCFDRSNEQFVAHCTVRPGGQAYLQPKVQDDSNKNMNTTDLLLNSSERFLSVKICDKKELMLPISRADKRYFPLYRDSNQEPWGIISEVTVEMGATIIKLRGILQVENHFTTSINVHTFSNNEVQLIAEIPPNTVYDIPLQIIYGTNKDLHFSMNGYKVSVQSISWKENPSDFNLVKTLQCDPVKTYEPLYMNAIRQRHEVYHEVSTKCTMLSTCFVVHIWPPLSVRNALPIDIILSIAGSGVTRVENDRDAEQIDFNASAVAGEDFLDYGEKLVKPGELLYLPTVKTVSKNVEQHSYIVARLQQYLEKDWSCTTEIPAEPPNFGVWTFNSYDSVEKMSLSLGVRYESRNGGLQLTIYCPFWMLNKTGLMLTYRANDENANLLYHPPEYDGPILFSFREKAFFGKKKAAIRVDTGEWCDRFSLDVAGSAGVVTCKSNDIVYQIGVHNTLTHNSLTKQIVLMPYFVLINRSSFAIEVQEEKRTEDLWIRVEPDACVPFWPKIEKSELLLVKVADTEEITAPFNFTEVQCTLLPLKNKFGGINVDVHVTEGAVYINFTGYFSGDAPALIINHTSEDITFWEKGNINARLLRPNQMMLYAWVNPVGEKQLTWNSGRNKIENDLRKDGLEKFRINEHPEEAYWVSFLDGTQRVLMFTNNPDIASNVESGSDFIQVTQEIVMDIHGLGLSLVNNEKHCEIMYIGVTSSGVIWEEKKKSRFKPMKIRDNGIVEAHFQEYLIEQHLPTANPKKYYLEVGKNEIDFTTMTLKKSTERQIRRTFYSGVWLEMKSSSHQLQLHVKINKIQIDNQLPDCIFPVVLAPIPPPKSVAALTEMKPFIEMSVVQRIIPHSTVKQFKYMKLLTQEFHVKVDLLFVNEIFEMLSSEITEKESKKLFTEDLNVQSQPLMAHVSQHSQQELKNFYDNLHLGPLKIHVSFSMAGSESTTLPAILSTLLQGVGVTLTDVNDVVFRLAFFEREYQFLTQRQLVSQCITHYAGQAVKQLYVLVLGLDVIGNPYGLVVGFTKGVEDLFYEPFQGAIQGPGEFAEGLVLGVRSLFGHTVGGAAGAVSKITGAMGKGVAALTFDKDYQKSRRDALNKKPANLQEGLARSGKGLVMGVFDGVTGVVTKPISGARSEGVGGFFKGLGQGAVGLVARPAAGVIDFASGSFDAVKRATELSDEAMRLRPSRFIQPDGIVRSYSKRDSEGFKYFRELDKGKYANTDSFEYFEEIVAKRDIVILTNYRIIYAVKNDIFGGWQCEWTYKWPEIKQIRSISTGVEIVLESREGKSKIMKMFGSADANRKLIIMNQKSRRDLLADKMNKLKL